MGNKLRSVDVGRLFNRSASWVKYLERAGIIPPAARDELNGARVYSPEDVERICEAVRARRNRGMGG